MKNNWKYIYYCILILCGGFAVLEYMEGNPKNATGWLLALAIAVFVWAWFKQKVKEPPQSALESVLEPETRQRLESGEEIHFTPNGIRLKNKEVCYWYDNAAQDYYDGKKGQMYLTNERLLFYAPAFSFTHPLDTLTMKPTRTGVEVDVHGKKMKFVTASTPLLLEIWKKHTQS